jgi:hypothetical protein
MATYESIHGTRVRYLTSDPTLDSSTEGQVWYNSTSGANKALVQIKAWSSGGNLIKGRYELGAVGTSTAGLAFGGNRAVSSPTGLQTDTEEYNGFAWASGGALPAAKATQGFGVQTAAVACGGTIAPNPTAGATTEDYNGSSWTSSGALNTATTGQAASTGLESAGLRAGGGSSPSARLNAVEEYNGSAWTSVTSIPEARFEFQGTGPQTASFFTGGSISSTTETDDTFNYDGTNWTSGPTMPFGLRKQGVSGDASTTNLTFGGEQAPGGRNLSVFFDGSSFSADATLGTGRNALGGFGAGSSTAIACGGNNAPSYDLQATEEYNSNINAITQAAFASGGNLNTGRGFAGAATQGSQNSALHFGGWAPPSGARTAVEEYNGSSWSEVTDLGTAQYYVAGAGTQTAALGFGGYTTPPAVITAKTVEYDGSSWTNGGDLNTARSQIAGAGTQTAGLAFGGEDPTRTKVEEYNGSAWTNVTAKSTPTASAAGTGIQTAALSLGGPTVATELYDGTNWTSGGNMNVIRTSVTSATGTQTLGLIAKGNLPPGNNLITNTEKFDGTTFATSASVTTGAQYACGTGATIGGVIHGGGTPLAGTNSTEEFTDGTETITASTLTTS